MLLEGVQDDPEHAWQVLALAGGAGNAMQQIQAAQLALQFGPIALDTRQHVIERVGEQGELLAGRFDGAHRIVAVLGHLSCRRGKRQEGLGDHSLQASRDQVRGDTAHQHERRTGHYKELEVLVDLPQI